MIGRCLLQFSCTEYEGNKYEYEWYKDSCTLFGFNIDSVDDAVYMPTHTAKICVYRRNISS